MLEGKPRLQGVLVMSVLFLAGYGVTAVTDHAWTGLFTFVSFGVVGVLLLLAAKAGEFGGPKT